MSNDNENPVAVSRTKSAAASEQSRFAHLESKRRLQIRLTARIIDEFFETGNRDRKELFAHIIDIATVYREELARLIHTDTIAAPPYYNKLLKTQSDCLWWTGTVRYVYPSTATYDPAKMPLTQEERILRLLHDAAETFKQTVRHELDASLAYERTRGAFHILHILLEDDIESEHGESATNV